MSYEKALSHCKTEAQMFYNYGNLLDYKFKELDKSVKAYNSCLKLDPEHAWAYYNRGYVYHRRKQYSEAREDYIKALEFDSDNPMAWKSLARIYQNQDKDYEAAKTA